MLQTFNSQPITYDDCTGLSSLVAYGLLRATSLPKDVEVVNTDSAEALGKMMQYIVLVSFPFSQLLFFKVISFDYCCNIVQISLPARLGFVL